MNEDLENEIEALNSIYGEGTLVLSSSSTGIFVLRFPERATTLRIQFPPTYPAVPPLVLGSESSGEHTRKGEAAYTVDVFRDALGRVFRPGEVCLFDAVEDVNQGFSWREDADVEENESLAPEPTSIVQEKQPPPPWTLSEVITEMKSVFIARAAPVSSPDQAQSYLQHLLETDKKVRTATHNITAWRIKGEGGVTYQDCDDDGETAAGGRVLRLLQMMDVWGVMVVVTRWYGGQQLGPKRFGIINTLARDALVRAGFGGEEGEGKKKGKK